MKNTLKIPLGIIGGEDAIFSFRVTVTAGQTTTPKFNFKVGYPVAQINWGDGSALESVSATVALSHTYAVGGIYKVTLVMQNQPYWLTEIDINTCRVYDGVTNIGKFPNLTSFFAQSNSSWVQNISNWSVPTKLINLYLYSSPITGNVSSWVIPATLRQLYIQSTNLSGNISGWTFPSAMVYIALSNTLFTGSVSSWVLPTSIVQFSIDSTVLSGDISSWNVPATMQFFDIYATSITGCPTLSSMVAIKRIKAQNCALPQADVDAYLSRCVARMASCTYHYPELNLGVNNSTPSAQGLTDKATLTTAGWTVTTNP
jgi:hypothetical protein